MIQLLPDKIKIRFKIRGVSGSHWSSVFQIQTDGYDFMNNGRPGGKNNNPVCHADRFRNIMCDKDCSLFFLTQNPADIITDIEAGLIVECGERFIKQKKFRLQCESTDQGGSLTHSSG